MKTTIKKLSALLLALTMLFSLSCVPASAVNIYEEDTFYGLKEVYDYGNKEDNNFFQRIADTFHWYIARLFFHLGADCPICDEHFIPLDFYNDLTNCYNNAVNNLKNYNGIVTIAKKETVDIIVNTCPSAIESIVNGVAKKFIGTTENTYTFISGKTVDSSIKITDFVEPLGRDAELNPNAIAESFLGKTLDNIPESLYFKLVEENASFDGTSSVDPVYNMGITDPINLAALDLTPIKITHAESTYPGTKVSAEFDELGRITALKIEAPLSVSPNISVAMLKATIDVDANITTEYTITYVS